MCELRVSWRRATEGEFCLRLSALVPNAEEDSWRAAISLSRDSAKVGACVLITPPSLSFSPTLSLKGELMCQWRHGVASHNCSIDCLATNVTYSDHSLDCRQVFRHGSDCC